MELKHHGDLLATLYDMEQALQSIYLNSEEQELTTAKVLLHRGLSRLAKSIAVLTSNSDEAASIRMEQLSSTWTFPTPISWSSSPLPEPSSPGPSDAVNIWEDGWAQASPEIKEAILSGIARGDIWLTKRRFDKNGNRIYGNVCLEVFLKSRGTCLLEHINLAAGDLSEIPQAFVDGMTELCDLHGRTGVAESGEYLSPSIDRQVGLGMLGLANLLSLEGVTYSEFADALDFNRGEGTELSVSQQALKIVKAIDAGIKSAASVARAHNMDRAFAIAPTASCSYRYTDRAGYTTAPEIAPPIGRTVDRDSSTFGVQQYDYGNVETAQEVGWDTYFRVVNGIMDLVHSTGLSHGYSFNSWSDIVRYDNDFVETWLASPQTSLYYSLQVMANTQAKDDAMAALDDQFADLFDFSDITDDVDSVPDFNNIFNDPAACVGCAE